VFGGLLFGVAASCVVPTSGLDAWLRVPGATYQADVFPPPSGGPDVLDARLTTNDALPGERAKPVEGTLAPDATGLLLGLRDDVGHWRLAAEVPNVLEPELPSFSVDVDFSLDVPLGEQTLLVAATDADGRVGAARELPITILPAARRDATLVVALAWDVEADLDLRVVLPSGVEISKSNINSYQPPAPGQQPSSSPEQGGVLDFDSNAGCVIDGRKREEVFFVTAPPSGEYRVLVDAFSLCDAGPAQWKVTVVGDGEVLGEASGLSTREAEEAPHGPLAGDLALRFEWPP
jgi:hypothetical protein